MALDSVPELDHRPGDLVTEHGRRRKATSPFITCRSVWHTPQALTRTRISPRRGRGMGICSSTKGTPGSGRTAASMESVTARCPVPVAPSCRTLRPTHPAGEDYVRTQVGIVGAGPAGLLLAHLLHLRGIESVILESRSREYVEQRIRAGVLEQGTVDLLARSGLDERLRREGLVHHGIELQFDGEMDRAQRPRWWPSDHRVRAAGRQDLIEARIETGGPLLFEAEALRLEGLDSRPAIRYRHEDREHELSSRRDRRL